MGVRLSRSWFINLTEVIYIKPQNVNIKKGEKYSPVNTRLCVIYQ